MTNLATSLGVDARLVARIAKALDHDRALDLSRGDVVGPGGNVGQFWTPSWLARGFARWMRIGKNTRVLDAGAGMGALSLAALELGARVTSVEIDERIVPQLASTLVEYSASGSATVVHRDFLGRVDRRQTALDTGLAFDVSISNPPWENDLPERFLGRQLEHAPRAGAIVPINVLCGVARASFWRDVEITRAKFLPRRANFGGPGGGKRDVMLIEVVVRSSPRMPGDVDRAEIEVGE